MNRLICFNLKYVQLLRRKIKKAMGLVSEQVESLSQVGQGRAYWGDDIEA